MWSQTLNQKKPHSDFHSAASFITTKLTFGILTKAPSKNIWQHEENTLREQKRQHNLEHIYITLYSVKACFFIYLTTFTGTQHCRWAKRSLQQRSDLLELRSCYTVWQRCCLMRLMTGTDMFWLGL